MAVSSQSGKSSDHDQEKEQDKHSLGDKNIENLFRQTRSINIDEDVIEHACNIVGSAWDKRFSAKISARFSNGH